MDYVEQESKVLIQVEETPALWQQESCPHCQHKVVRDYDHAPERRWRHLNVCQLHVEATAVLLQAQLTTLCAEKSCVFLCYVRRQ